MEKNRKIKVTFKILIVLTNFSVFLFNYSVFAKPQYCGSDVVRYALTAHGTKYLFQSKAGAVNKWSPKYNNKQYNLQAVKRKDSSGRLKDSIKTVIDGNTDCSALYSKSIRWNGYKKPEVKSTGAPNVITTHVIQNFSRDKSNGFSRTHLRDAKDKIRHGDALNYRNDRAGEGHVLIFNGFNSLGNVDTVEARCSHCGVGRFSRSWAVLKSSNYYMIKYNKIFSDITNQRTVIPLNKMNAQKTTIDKGCYKTAFSNDSAATVTTSKPDNSSAATTSNNSSTGVTENSESLVDTAERISHLDSENTDQNVTSSETTDNSPVVENVTTNVNEVLDENFSVYNKEEFPPEDYKVKKGDTLSHLALQFNTNVNTIKELNGDNIIDTTIYVDQVIKVPAKGLETFDHVVKSNESLGQIAAKYKVTLDSIYFHNSNLNSSSTIKDGQTIKIPKKSNSEAVEGVDYILVKFGDNLYNLSKEHGIDEKKLRQLNKIPLGTKFVLLKIGQILWLKEKTQ